MAGVHSEVSSSLSSHSLHPDGLFPPVLPHDLLLQRPLQTIRPAERAAQSSPEGHVALFVAAVAIPVLHLHGFLRLWHVRDLVGGTWAAPRGCVQCRRS